MGYKGDAHPKLEAIMPYDVIVSLLREAAFAYANSLTNDPFGTIAGTVLIFALFTAWSTSSSQSRKYR
jgi:hypothetical protein